MRANDQDRGRLPVIAVAGGAAVVGVVLVALDHRLVGTLVAVVAASTTVWLSLQATGAWIDRAGEASTPGWVGLIDDVVADAAHAVVALGQERRRIASSVQAGYFALDVPTADGRFHERLRATLEDLDAGDADPSKRTERLVEVLEFRRQVLAPPPGSGELRACAAALWRGLEAMEDRVDLLRTRILEDAASEVRRIGSEAGVDAAPPGRVAEALVAWSTAECVATKAARSTDAAAYIEAADAVLATPASIRTAVDELVARAADGASRTDRPPQDSH